MDESRPMPSPGARALPHHECHDDRPPVAQRSSQPGAMLVRAREAAGLTLEDLARTTKISRANLTAIETADLERLPALVYVRGFVKAYAREVGLDPDHAAGEYVARLERLAAKQAAEAAPLAAGPAPGKRETTAPPEPGLSRFSRLFVVAAAVGLVLYLIMPVWRGSSTSPPGEPLMEPEAVARVNADAAPAVGPAPVEAPDPVAPVATAGVPLQVELV